MIRCTLTELRKGAPVVLKIECSCYNTIVLVLFILVDNSDGRLGRAVDQQILHSISFFFFFFHKGKPGDTGIQWKGFHIGAINIIGWI